MASVPVGGVLRHLGRLFSSGSATGLGETELLGRFVADRDEAAFEALVERHGPMVLAVCRRLLAGDSHAVDDAFQATFLVLVRRAGSIRDPGRLGPWLYGVAHRVARRARADSRRRRARERGGELMTTHEPIAPTGGDPDRGDELHEELRRLPAAYRDVLVVCDLEGRSHEEAARLLGWPVGTVKGRLSRAREQLRGRLVRRGIAFSLTALVAALEADAQAAVPTALLDSTVGAAMSLAAGKALIGAGLAPAAATALADGVHRSMGLQLFGGATLAVVTAGTLATASALIAFGPGPQAATDKPATVRQAGTGEMRKAAGSAEAQKPPADADNEAAIAEARTELEQARLAIKQRNYELSVAQVVDMLPQWQSSILNGVRETSIAMMNAEIPTLGAEAAAHAHFERLSGLAKKIAEALENPPAEPEPGGVPAMMRGRMGGRGPGGMASMMGGMGGMGGGAGRMGMVLPEGTAEIPEVKLLVAEAKLWVAEARAQRPMTGLMGSGPLATEDEPSPAADPNLDATTRAILAVLEKPIPLKFPQGASLEEVLGAINTLTQETKNPNLPASGLPMYVDPVGLQEAGMTMQSPVQIALEGVPLKTGLRLLLSQLGLNYVVKDGMILINTPARFASDFAVPQSIEGDPPIPGYGAMPKKGAPRVPAPEGSGGAGGMMGGEGGSGGFR